MAGITSAVLGTGMGLYQAFSGSNREDNANRALNDYERQELDNAYKDIQISTMGSDLLREENARTSAGLIDTMQQAGTRAIIGGVPKVIGATNQINQQAAKMIDDQVMNRDYAIAGDNARIEGITENRDNANINALSSQSQAGRQDMWSGIMGTASGLAYGAKNIDFGGEGSWNQRNGVANSIVNSEKSPSNDNQYSSNPYSYDFMNDNYGKRNF